MINKVNSIQNSNIHSYSCFQSSNQVKKGFRTYRYHNIDKPTTGDRIRAMSGAVIGTLLPLAYFAKKQNGTINSFKNLFNIQYNLKEMVSITAGTIIGGVTLGMLGESRQKCKKKINEGVFQFMNSFMPAIFVSGFLKLSKNKKMMNNPLLKSAGVFASLCSGMYIGAKVSNFITDPKNIHPDRKLNMKDAAANIDDLIGALVLAKFPVADNLNVEKVLPVIYTWCGYRAGQNS